MESNQTIYGKSVNILPINLRYSIFYPPDQYTVDQITPF